MSNGPLDGEAGRCDRSGEGASRSLEDDGEIPSGGCEAQAGGSTMGDGTLFRRAADECRMQARM